MSLIPIRVHIKQQDVGFHEAFRPDKVVSAGPQKPFDFSVEVFDTDTEQIRGYDLIASRLTVRDFIPIRREQFIPLSQREALRETADAIAKLLKMPTFAEAKATLSRAEISWRRAVNRARQNAIEDVVIALRSADNDMDESPGDYSQIAEWISKKFLPQAD